MYSTQASRWKKIETEEREKEELKLSELVAEQPQNAPSETVEEVTAATNALPSTLSMPKIEMALSPKHKETPAVLSPNISLRKKRHAVVEASVVNAQHCRNPFLSTVLLSNVSFNPLNFQSASKADQSFQPTTARMLSDSKLELLVHESVERWNHFMHEVKLVFRETAGGPWCPVHEPQ